MTQAFWIAFWSFALLVSGVIFAVITAIVAVKGGGELIAMFRRGLHRK